LATAAFSALTIGHNAWGARLGGDASQRSRWVAWREGWGLLGVVLASFMPIALGFSGLIAFLLIAIGIAIWGLGSVPKGHEQPAQTACAAKEPPNASTPWAWPAFRRLLAVFVLSGLANAVPATLMLFFVQDRLQAPASLQAAFLGVYFACAAAGLPLWLWAVRRWGLAATWAGGLVLAVACFAGAMALSAGDWWGFGWVCAFSGMALGADLALPAALLAGVIQRHSTAQAQEGQCFGWWAFATKLNLALAAGLALPLLAALGYAPGAQDAQALQALTWVYCGVPCALKLLAAVVWISAIRKETFA